MLVYNLLYLSIRLHYELAVLHWWPSLMPYHYWLLINYSMPSTKVALLELGRAYWDGRKVIWWSQVAEALRGDKATIRFLVSSDEYMITESKQVYAEFQQYFAELYGARDGSGMVVDFTFYLNGMSHLSARDTEFCEMLMTAKIYRTSWRHEQERGLRSRMVYNSLQ